MARIEGEIVIARPVDEVFGYAADQRNEPEYNPRMARSEKVTSGPVGAATGIGQGQPDAGQGDRLTPA